MSLPVPCLYPLRSGPTREGPAGSGCTMDEGLVKPEDWVKEEPSRAYRKGVCGDSFPQVLWLVLGRERGSRYGSIKVNPRLYPGTDGVGPSLCSVSWAYIPGPLPRREMDKELPGARGTIKGAQEEIVGPLASCSLGSWVGTEQILGE